LVNKFISRIARAKGRIDHNSIETAAKKEDLGSAIALKSSLVNGARLIEPSIAGILIAATGRGSLLSDQRSELHGGDRGLAPDEDYPRRIEPRTLSIMQQFSGRSTLCIRLRADPIYSSSGEPGKPHGPALYGAHTDWGETLSAGQDHIQVLHG
jgi:hypothetical protein